MVSWKLASLDNCLSSSYQEQPLWYKNEANKRVTHLKIPGFHILGFKSRVELLLCSSYLSVSRSKWNQDYIPKDQILMLVVTVVDHLFIFLFICLFIIKMSGKGTCATFVNFLLIAGIIISQNLPLLIQFIYHSQFITLKINLKMRCFLEDIMPNANKKYNPTNQIKWKKMGTYKEISSSNRRNLT